MAETQPTEMVKTETATETVTETQPENTKAQTVEELRAELDRTAKALKEANKEAAARRKKLEDFEKADEDKKRSEMSELEKAKADLAKYQSELEAVKLNDLKRTTAAKYGIPENLATRLVGATAEEIEADAKQLSETLPKAKEIKASPGVTNPGVDGNIIKTPEQRGKDLLYSGNMNWAGGGGVRMPD